MRKPPRVRSQMTAFQFKRSTDYCSGNLGDISAQYLGMCGSGLFLALSLPYPACVCVLCMDECARACVCVCVYYFKIVCCVCVCACVCARAGAHVLCVCTALCPRPAPAPAPQSCQVLRHMALSVWHSVAPQRLGSLYYSRAAIRAAATATGGFVITWAEGCAFRKVSRATGPSATKPCLYCRASHAREHHCHWLLMTVCLWCSMVGWGFQTAGQQLVAAHMVSSATGMRGSWLTYTRH